MLKEWQRAGPAGHIVQHLCHQGGFDLDTDPCRRPQHGIADLVGAERGQRLCALGEKRSKPGMGKGPVVEVGAQPHHQTQPGLGPEAVDEGIEEARRLVRAGSGVELLELVDHQKQADFVGEKVPECGGQSDPALSQI